MPSHRIATELRRFAVLLTILMVGAVGFHSADDRNEPRESRIPRRGSIPAEADGVAELLEELTEKGDHLVLDAGGAVYVQVVRQAEEWVIAEAVSNELLPEEVIGETGRERLRLLGWEKEPGWNYTSVHELANETDRARLARHLLRTLAEGYGWSGETLAFSRGTSRDQPLPRIPGDVEGVERLLANLTETRQFLILTANSGAYVQFIVQEEGGITAEAVSNRYVGEEVLDGAGRGRLALLGWQEPQPAAYSMDLELETAEQRRAAAELILRTLAEAYRWLPGSGLAVTRGE